MTQNNSRPFWIITTVAVLLALGAGYAGVRYTMENTKPPQPSATIGGPFQLLSPAGSIVNDGIFRGHWMLMYFGASRCPENSCTKQLIKMGQVMELLGNKASQVTPIFISFDINYDTATRLMLYMKSFNSKIIALTGGELSMRDLSILYHVPIQKVTMADKTKIIRPYNQFLIIDPKGNYNSSISVDTSKEQIVEKLKSLIQ